MVGVWLSELSSQGDWGRVVVVGGEEYGWTAGRGGGGSHILCTASCFDIIFPLKKYKRAA